MKLNAPQFFSLSLLTASLLFTTQVTANSGGMVGRSGNPLTPLAEPGTNCNACHNGGIPPDAVFTGPKIVEKGSTHSYELIMSGGQKINGGFNVSVDAGEIIQSTNRTQLLAPDVPGLPKEITQRNALKVSTDVTGTLVWKFDWKAPTVAGDTIMYGSVLSGNAADYQVGDKATSIKINIKVIDVAPTPVAPKAKITTVKSGSIGTPISISAGSSTDADGGIKDYLWEFNDGSTDSGKDIHHTFSNTGVFIIKLTVTDDSNLTDTTFVDIKVMDTSTGNHLYPVAVLTAPTHGNTNQAIDFNGDQSYESDANITNLNLTYLWDFGDDKAIKAPTAETLISHTFDNPGTYIVRMVVLDNLSLMGITSKTIEITDAPVVNTTPETIYNTNCAACHGVAGIGGSAKNIKGATKLLIENAIAGIPVAIPDMSAIQISATDLQTIVDYLAITVDETGPELFKARCELCHGAKGAGGSAKMIQGATAAQITAAITTSSATAVPLMAGINLTLLEANSIEAFLVVNPGGGGGATPKTGKELYDATCLQCHGPDGSGGSAKVITNKSAALIKQAYANIPAMKTITLLTDPEIQLVADFLVRKVSGDPVAGEHLFIKKCQKCHGTGDGGYALPILNASEQMITAAIDQTSVPTVPVMSGIVLTATEKQNLVALLATGGLPKPTNGNDLYTMYCSHCHGANGLGNTIGGRIRGVGMVAADIIGAMTGGEALMSASYLSQILTPTEIQLIANTL